MKKKIITILMFALVSVLLISAITVSVSASENQATPTVSIDKFNLVFEDNVYLKYAVKFDGVADEHITSNNTGMLYYTSPQKSYTEENSTHSSKVIGYTNIDGEKYYTFEYRNITAKQMTDYIYSVAYIDIDGERIYSAPVKYSVLDYCYSKLGKTGTASDNEDYINLLSATLTQGAMAQKFFKYNTDRLANDTYFAVETVGGTLGDGFTHALYKATETATLIAPEIDGDLVFDGWYNAAGDLISTDNPCTITAFTKNETYTAAYMEKIKYSEGLSLTSNRDGTCYVSGVGTCTDTEVYIPLTAPNGDKVTGIGSYAFTSCNQITSVTIGNNITSIGSSAFSYCDRLTDVTIGDGLTSISDSAFFNCPIVRATVPAMATRNIRGAGIIKELTITSGEIPDNVFFGHSSITSLTIGNGVTSIGSGAFYQCYGLTSVTIPNSVVSIGNIAFQFCENLTSVVIEDGVKIIGDSAFGKCVNLTNITIPDSITSIGEYAFDSCAKLASVTIPDGVTNIGEKTFRGCAKLTSITIPDSVTSIGDDAFAACVSLASITIPKSVTNLSNDAFAGCIGLTSLIVDENNPNYTSIDGNLYSKDGKILIQYAVSKSATAFIIPDGVTDIGDYAFYGCINLTSITIPNGITYIGDSAFLGCYKLVEVINHSDLVIFTKSNKNGYVGYYAMEVHDGESKMVDQNDFLFYVYGGKNYLMAYKGNSSEIVLPDNYKGAEYEIYESAFSCNVGLTSVIIPNSVTSIGSYVFECCTNLTRITIPESVTNISNDAFAGCIGLTSLIVDENNPNYTSIDGNLYSKDGKILIQYAVSKSATAFIIPDGVTDIGDYALYGCTGLTSITIPDSVTSIGYATFYGCTGLTSITIPDSVTSIGAYAFEGCTGLTSVTISDSVTSIGDYAFDNCPIEHAIIPADAAPYIKNPALKDVIITSGVSIPQSAFENCTELTSVTIPDSVTNIGNFAFSGCTGLTSITFPENVTTISHAAFYGCTGLENLTIPDSVKSIGSYAFESCIGLKSITIGNGVTSISSPFRFCIFENATIPAIVIPYIKDNSNLKVVVITSGENIPEKAFFHCTNLESVTIGDGVINIGDYAFSECNSLTSIEIPDSVTSIGNSAFSYSTKLESVTIGDGVINIGDYAFSNCTSLTSVEIPDSVTSIGNYAFRDCRALTNINYCGTEEQWNAISKGTLWDSGINKYTITYNYASE